MAVLLVSWRATGGFSVVGRAGGEKICQSVLEKKLSEMWGGNLYLRAHIGQQEPSESSPFIKLAEIAKDTKAPGGVFGAVQQTAMANKNIPRVYWGIPRARN